MRGLVSGLGVIIVIGVLSWPRVLATFELNAAAITALRAAQAGSTSPLVGFDQSTSDIGCRIIWLGSMIAHAAGRAAESENEWRAAIECGPIYVQMLFALAPDNERLAQQAVDHYPQSATALFWLAKIRSELDPNAALALYRRGLTIEPGASARWRELGDLLRMRGEFDAALDAYLQSCYHGDFGSNGCWQAGLTAEQHGDIESAIKYLRLSRWSVALEYADKLEQQQHNKPAP